MTNVSRAGRSGRLPRLLVAGLALLAALTIASPAGAEVTSARSKFEGNKWLSRDRAGDEVRTDVIRFDWPSAVLGVKSGYKAVVKVVNSSTKQVSAGLAVALYDGDGKLLGAGTTGTKIGTIDPGDSAEFTVSFDHVIERLSQTTQFQIALQTR
jgi:hypothetical protein